MEVMAWQILWKSSKKDAASGNIKIGRSPKNS
jgi:hypothetical protein